jgi:RNA polymerase sigma factor (TIGR02999 family)
MTTTSQEISRLLQEWNRGDKGARDRLMPLVFDELHEIARRQYEKEKPGHTLQPTAIVSELYLKLVRQERVQWQNRQEFFAIAAKLVRRILVDHARRRQAAKRGSDAPKIAFDEALGVPNLDDPALIALDEALKDLEATDERGSRVVELHAFGGLTFEEIAQAMDLSRGTVFRDWKHARLWLRRELRRAAGKEEEE